MSKKKLRIGILVLIILIITIIIYIIEREQSIEIIQKGYELFGNEYCEGKHFEGGSDAEGGWTCKICGHNTWLSYMPYYQLCHFCDKVTGRCFKCGKLLYNSKPKISARFWHITINFILPISLLIGVYIKERKSSE